MSILDKLFGRQRRIREVWTHVARELGGTHHMPTGWWKRTTERIEAVVDGIPVVLDTFVVSTGNATVTYTRVAASFAHGPGPSGSVYRQRFWSAIGKAIGLEDVELGEPGFDSTFMVKADSPALTRRLWTQHAMAHMLGPFVDAKLTCDARGIKLVETGLWSERAKLHAGIALVVELARRDLYGIAGLGAVTDATLVQPPGTPPRVELDTGVRVIIAAEDHEGQLVTIARASETSVHVPLVIDIVDGSVADPQLASKLPQGAHVSLRSVGTGTLVVEASGLHFRWRDIELDPGHLRAGAELLGAIAAADGGVYR